MLSISVIIRSEVDVLVIDVIVIDIFDNGFSG
jgi:hypothetical protein